MGSRFDDVIASIRHQAKLGSGQKAGQAPQVCGRILELLGDLQREEPPVLQLEGLAATLYECNIAQCKPTLTEEACRHLLPWDQTPSDVKAGWRVLAAEALNHLALWNALPLWINVEGAVCGPGGRLIPAGSEGEPTANAEPATLGLVDASPAVEPVEPPPSSSTIGERVAAEFNNDGPVFHLLRSGVLTEERPAPAGLFLDVFWRSPALITTIEFTGESCQPGDFWRGSTALGQAEVRRVDDLTSGQLYEVTVDPVQDLAEGRFTERFDTWDKARAVADHLLAGLEWLNGVRRRANELRWGSTATEVAAKG